MHLVYDAYILQVKYIQETFMLQTRLQVANNLQKIKEKDFALSEVRTYR